MPPGCENLPVDSWVDLQNRLFKAERLSVARDYPQVEDALASDGLAAKLDGDNGGKKIYLQLWRIPMTLKASEANEKLHCRISVRCELTGKDGVAFNCVVPGRGRPLEVKAADVKGDGYYTYDMGVYDNMYGWVNLWVSAGDNPQNVQAVYVDRVWLVKDEIPGVFVEGFETGTFGKWTTAESDYGHDINFRMGIWLYTLQEGLIPPLDFIQLLLPHQYFTI